MKIEKYKRGKPIEDENIDRLRQREQLIKESRNLTLFSDTFLSVALDDIPACQHIIRILMKRSDLRIKEVRTQYTISKVISHGACLDVLAEDEGGYLYNIEIQNADNLDHIRRTRFYQAMADSEFLKKGTDYGELPELYIFYISLTDILEQGQTVYHMEKYWRETGQIVDDGVHIMFVNAQIDDGSEIAGLMKYFRTSDPEDMSQGALSERIRFLKGEKGEADMCEYSDKLIAFGKEEGRMEGRIEIIRCFLENGIQLEVIAQIVGDSVEQIKKWMQEEEGKEEQVKYV